MPILILLGELASSKLTKAAKVVSVELSDQLTVQEDDRISLPESSKSLLVRGCSEANRYSSIVALLTSRIDMGFSTIVTESMADGSHDYKALAFRS